jgi:hypothetical protein
MASLKDILKDVPQNPRHHPEGNVWNHVKMVRQSMNDAIALMNQAQQDPNSPFSNFNMNLTQDEKNILRLGGWLHDIGKSSATKWTVDKKNKIPWKEVPPEYEGEEGEKGWQAIGHESPKHFEPEMKKLDSIWKNMYDAASTKDKDDLWFIINNHMSLRPEGFGKKRNNQWFDENSKYKNERKIKLLLILIIMDRMGRGTPKEGDLAGTSYRTVGPIALAHMVNSAQKHKEKLDKDQELRDIQKAKSNLSPKEFVSSWINEEKPLNALKGALRGKFPDLNDEDIENILP